LLKKCISTKKFISSRNYFTPKNKPQFSDHLITLAIHASDYAIDEVETREANIYLSWRGHIDTVTQIALIDHREIVITSSTDCTCRAWTFDGEYVGTFGQNQRWDLTDDATWKHPFTPDDVLIDPQSVPDIKTEQESGDTTESAWGGFRQPPPVNRLSGKGQEL